MKKRVTLSVLSLSAMMALSACGKDSAEGGGSGDQVKLTMMSTATTKADQQIFKEIVADFEKAHPEIDIEDTYPGDGYEDLARVKMAADDMPDLFDTHGWAKSRYGEYTEDLSGMDWVKNLDEAMKPILTDDKGKLHAYPVNQALDGMSYNKTLLDKYGIEPPKTFDELMAALEEVKKKSKGEVVPFWLGGSDKSQFGQYFDEFATPLLITDKENSHGEALLDGSFDWSNYTYLPQKLKEMNDKGLLNKDVLTAQVTQGAELMAQNKIAFTMLNGSVGREVSELNPEVQVGTIPVPAIHEGDSPSWIGGERHTFAISKNSEHKEEAKQFIEYLTQPEVAKKLAEGTSLPDALTNVDADNYFAEFYKEYEGTQIQPYFDRVYLPSGMWDPMGATGQELIAGTMKPKQVSEKMEEEYKRLRAE
ncbi:ABC transporter substrate-binding protein [Domibacillus sp. DTU_2020_1001157_1_SI_ALB_TIR_016]|uniref:ABC transporter substrate-binding protein n=1 Tax=Domibacillus sp. DTU_2020_1001157_1_SI_ALB_TIR_016 TaxID=3077789 RepID=UPI0028E1A4CF|nr:ABC transporter substrate-binding protein [Domibacillus sp. DTU_2020_1001157_1_SI_ALB_TIR_016]WNS80609.1 ABC transporter substrate-binding protein [Domibacillus sp. DTU_2020_1001157_1_SI_ALB_TIR_016]